MNRNQKIVLAAGCIVLLIATAFPPFTLFGEVGYSWFGSPAKFKYQSGDIGPGRIYAARLYVEWGLIAVLTGAGVLLTWEKKA